MTTDQDLLGELGAALAPADRTPAADRIAAIRHAASNRAPADTRGPTLTAHPASRMRRIALVALAAAAGVALVVGGLVIDRDDHRSGDLLAGGVVEFETVIASVDGSATATATGVRTGTGRTVQLRTDDLPILPKGDLYELWFVGPGDTSSTPNRISAGTFHPDEQGRSHIDLNAAVDPALYPQLSVTAEPGDGDPTPTGPEVLRGDIALDEP